MRGAPVLVLLLMLAGCADPSARTPAIEVLQREATAASGDLVLTVTVHDHPDGVELRGVATNTGPSTLEGGVTCDAWRWWLSGPDGPRDDAVCLSYGVVSLPPGASDEGRRVWNATTRDDDGQRPLEAGNYAWNVRYCFDESPGGCASVQVPFRVS